MARKEEALVELETETPARRLDKVEREMEGKRRRLAKAKTERTGARTLQRPVTPVQALGKER